MDQLDQERSSTRKSLLARLLLTEVTVSLPPQPCRLACPCGECRVICELDLGHEGNHRGYQEGIGIAVYADNGEGIWETRERE